MPVWDKVVVNKPATNQRQTPARTGSLTDTIIYIPLVVPDSNRVSAFIYARLNNSINLQLHRANNYEAYGFGSLQDSTDNAEKLAVQFMLLDNQTFGHTNFSLLDNRLFKDNTLPPGTLTKGRKLYIKNHHSSQQARIEFWDYDICTSEMYWDCSVSGVCCNRAGVAPGECIQCEGCWKTKISCKKSTIVVFVDDGPPQGGGGGPTGDGGGGSGGGGSTDPTQCNPTPELDNGLPPCLKLSKEGWMPVNNQLVETSCETAQRMAKTLDTIFTSSKADSVLASIPNLATETKEKGFAITKKLKIDPYNMADTSLAWYKSSAVSTGTDSSIIISYTTGVLEYTAATLHTHPDKGYAAHSAKDIYEFLQGRIGEERHFMGTFVAAANGDQYAITITNPSQASAFLATKDQNLDGSKWRDDSDIGKAFENARKYYEKIYKGNPKEIHLAYEMAMSAVLNQFGAGITLNKKDAAGNFKPIVVRTGKDPNKPKKIIYTQDCL